MGFVGGLDVARPSDRSGWVYPANLALNITPSSQMAEQFSSRTFTRSLASASMLVSNGMGCFKMKKMREQPLCCLGLARNLSTHWKSEQDRHRLTVVEWNQYFHRRPGPRTDQLGWKSSKASWWRKVASDVSIGRRLRSHFLRTPPLISQLVTKSSAINHRVDSVGMDLLCNEGAELVAQRLPNRYIIIYN